MKVSCLSNRGLTINVIDKILFENIDDQNQNGDCIPVLGSKRRQPSRFRYIKQNRQKA